VAKEKFHVLAMDGILWPEGFGERDLNLQEARRYFESQRLHTRAMLIEQIFLDGDRRVAWHDASPGLHDWAGMLFKLADYVKQQYPDVQGSMAITLAAKRS